jgi:hypothetical protein
MSIYNLNKLEIPIIFLFSIESILVDGIDVDVSCFFCYKSLIFLVKYINLLDLFLLIGTTLIYHYSFSKIYDKY